MNQNNNIIDVDEANFNENIIEASKEKLVIVDFWAPWCGPCKQLTPLLEKITNKSEGKVLLAKVNIDDNQQVAGQLRIQSIPAVFAFKNGQIVDAFQGVIPEKKITEFIEKALGEKIEEDFSEFYESIKSNINEKKFSLAKESLENFIAERPKELKALSLYIQCLAGLGSFDEIDNLINSFDEDSLKNPDIESAIKFLEIAKNKNKGPETEELINKFNTSSFDINLLIQIADKYFATNDYENAFDILLKNYPKNKEKIKIKIVEFFNALGHDSETTVKYRKKFSQIMFS
tara:strand:- start:1029 stop:1895 length:867 start_codon:yes stop_codon:yes gene_type:complete